MLISFLAGPFENIRMLSPDYAWFKPYSHMGALPLRVRGQTDIIKFKSILAIQADKGGYAGDA